MASEAQGPGEQPGSADSTAPAEAFPRLRHIEITNYKAIDHLSLDIPAPTMPGDPDIFVVGSKNGLGKTSLLECCALAQLNHHDPARLAAILRHLSEDWSGEIRLVREPHSSLTINSRHGQGRPHSFEYPEAAATDRGFRSARFKRKISDDTILIEQLFGREPDVLLSPDLLFFHGYRKVSEGPVSSQEMLTRDESQASSAANMPRPAGPPLHVKVRACSTPSSAAAAWSSRGSASAA